MHKTIAEFAKAYRITPMTVYRLIRADKLRAVKVGGRTIITDDDERAFKASLPEVRPAATAA